MKFAYFECQHRRWVVRFTFRCCYPRDKGSQYPVDRCKVMLQILSEFGGFAGSGIPLDHQITSQFVRLEFVTEVTMKNGVFGDVTPVAFVRSDASKERKASFIRVTRISELGTTLAVTSNRRTLRRNTKWCFFAAFVGCQLQLSLFLVHRFLPPWWRRH
jgi:hypothetical protein